MKKNPEIFDSICTKSAWQSMVSTECVWGIIKGTYKRMF